MIKDLCAALAWGNNLECANRKLCIKTLWRCAGRAGEPAFISYEGMTWNAEFQTVVSEAPQSKVGKTKAVPFVAAKDRHAD